MARREGVPAVLFHHLREQRLEDLVPHRIVAALAQTYYANLQRNMRIIGALRKVLDAFQSVGLPCIVLKGIALAEHIYPNVALRGLSDVDLLIRKEDLLITDGVLRSIGFYSQDGSVAQSLCNPAGYLASLEYRQDPPSALSLHLHWHLVNTSVPATAFIGRIDLPRIWERSEAVPLADSEARVLCPEHLILYLCEHALRVGHSFDRLILICDLFFAIKTLEDRLDWDRLVTEGQATGLSRFAFHGLTIVKHYTGLLIPEPCLAQLQPAALSPGERVFLDLQRRRRIRGSSFLLYLAMNRGVPAKIRFIARTFFPPRQILLQRLQVRDTETAAGCYGARIGEIVAQTFRMLRRRS